VKPNKFSLSVVVPAHNEEKFISKCLNSLTKYLPEDPKGAIEIIVVDNASTDKTSAICKRYPNVKLIFEPKKGSNMARQKGFLEAKGDLLAFIDADSMITEKWLGKLKNKFQHDKKLVCLSGPYEFYDLPSWKRHITKFVFYTIYKPVFWLTRAAVIGGNFVVRKEALEKIGGFDVNINLFGDDMDLGRRIRKIGGTSFDLNFIVLSSGRRIRHGMIRTFFISYVLNYLVVMIFHRPLTRNHKDIR